MQCVSQQLGDAVLVSLSGRLDVDSAASAQRMFADVLTGGGSPPSMLMINTVELSFISSTGIRSLLLAAKQAKSAGIRLALVGLTPSIREILSLTGMLDMFGIYDSAGEALQSLHQTTVEAAPSVEIRELFGREIQESIRQIHGRVRRLNEGEVASYIPGLSKANPDHFGLCVVTADGRMFMEGDCDQEFTIQSISKPFTFGMALESCGWERVNRHVGLEPSGDAFNSIQLQSGLNRPYNPMVNAGAIAVSALLHAEHGNEAFSMVLERLSAAAGRPLAVDEAVYASERQTGHRNRAIAHLLLNFGMVHEDVEQALDVYFRQCSILITARDLGMMAATLANIGRQPVTGQQVFQPESVQSILSIMLTCGMYDYSGEWTYRVGVPAKSGVAGGLMAVVNRQIGIASYSPRLDARGNSHRGIESCKELAQRFGLHAFDSLNAGSNFLKALG